MTIGTVDDEVERAAREAWDALEKMTLDGVDSARLGPERLHLIRTARSRPELARLFPFTSLSRLCLSRCSEYPFTTDCPGIGVDKDGFWVFSDPYPNDGEEAAVVLLESADIDLALQTLIEHLPSDQAVWVGNANDL